MTACPLIYVLSWGCGPVCVPPLPWGQVLTITWLGCSSNTQVKEPIKHGGIRDLPMQPSCQLVKAKSPSRDKLDTAGEKEEGGEHNHK